MKYNNYEIILVVIVIMLAFLLVSCNMMDTQEYGRNTVSKTSTGTPFMNDTNEDQVTPMPNENENTDVQTPTATALVTRLPMPKVGYNDYGIPPWSMWELFTEKSELKDNIDEIVIDIKNRYNIPQCITGIPFDDRAKELLIDDNGELVSNWEEILEQLKSEWLDD